MELGAFSVSLSVKDIHTSKAFYEKLGFSESGGDINQNWLIMRNGKNVIGLFQGMFDDNILTFNPGLNNAKEEVEPFTDVREIQARLDAAGIEIDQRVADDAPGGPAHIVLKDPDGNAIMVDQFR